ncbi:EAL domain-containing protein [Lacticaseibacillus hulanensis]|uniref:EAL domain-containing protein n=1 Tax=Lacticaseibacillus hulanensis TaxID=2493111 RepID=UPI0013E39E80|nr:EAL domain-containing protein [Lacticaseibacillus hulanensis]
MITYTYFSQAIVELNTQEVVRHELLLRMWDADQKVWRLPDDFEITVAMQIKLMKRALRRLKVKNVNIKLTPSQFADADVMHKIVDFVHSTDELGSLTVELTAAPSLEDIKTIGAEYRKNGVQLAIDDVGSDCDDFDVVEKLVPYVDCLKFALQNMRAQGKMDNLEENIEQWATLAKEHNTQFTFEGIESFSDLRLAKKFDVQNAQGFYFSHPAEPVATH